MMDVFRMVGSIALQGGKEASRELEQFDEKGKKTSLSFKNMIGVVAGVTAGITALGASIGAITKKVMGLTDEIDKQSQRLGISRERYQELDFIISQNGGSISSMVMGVKTLSRAIDESSQGVETYRSNFKRLGVEYEDINGNLREQEDVLYDVLKALMEQESEVERNAIAQQLLGRSAVDLIPLLNQGADSFEELRQQAHEYGLILNDDVIDAGVKLTDTMDRINRSFRAAMSNAIGP